jgi:antitoxin ParD1/3/4
MVDKPFAGGAVMATINVSLPTPMKDWVENQTTDGRYSNSSDYVRELIPKDQLRQEAIATLQAAITEGLESGKPVVFDPAAFKLRMREKHLVS